MDSSAFENDDADSYKTAHAHIHIPAGAGTLESR